MFCVSGCRILMVHDMGIAHTMILLYMCADHVEIFLCDCYHRMFLLFNLKTKCTR